MQYESKIETVLPTAETVLDLDYSSKSLYIDNEANNTDYLRFYRQSENDLQKAPALSVSVGGGSMSPN